MKEDKPRWEKWKGEKKAEYEERLRRWEISEHHKTLSMVSGSGYKKSVDSRPGLKQVSKHACDTCALWVPNKEDSRGQCSRDPAWLITTMTHYCASWRKDL